MQKAPGVTNIDTSRRVRPKRVNKWPNGMMMMMMMMSSGVPRNFVRGGGSTNSVGDRGQRERGSGGGSPLVRGSGGSCNLVQEISFHIVTFS